MLSQLQNLQTLVANHFFDIIDWRRHVQPDPEFKSTGEVARILITTPFNRYRMALGTSFSEPPAGAPITCRSLGWVAFDDAAAKKHFLGPKADLLYMDISKHIHVRELTDALAAARREVAESGPDRAGAARAKLTEIAERAKKWGFDAKVPDGPVAAVPPMPAPQATVPDSPAPPPEASASGASTMAAPSATAGEPWIGAPVIFITNPGEQISGMQEIPGHIVRIEGDRVCIFLTADNSEPIYRDKLHRRGTPAGNGRVHQFNCWDFNPVYERERRRVRDLEEAVGKMADESNRDRETIAALQQAVTDLTARMATAESSAADLMARLAAMEKQDRSRKGKEGDSRA